MCNCERDVTTGLLEYLAVQAMKKALPSLAPRYRYCKDGKPHQYYVAHTADIPISDSLYIEFACKRCTFRFKDPIPHEPQIKI